MLSPHASDVTAENVSPFYIPAASRARLGRTLKHGDTFVVFDNSGDAQASGPASEGVFHEDTRFLSRLALVVNGARPLLLSSAATADNEMLTADLTNPDFFSDGHLSLARDTVHLLRVKVLADGACFESIEVKNYAEHDVSLDLCFAFAADFADMFEVRGQKREQRGRMLKEEIDGARVVLGYRGLDRVTRRTELTFDPPPRELTKREARYTLKLPPGGATTLTLAIRCLRDGAAPAPETSFTQSAEAAQALVRRRRAAAARIATSNTSFNAWLERSRADLDMLITDMPTGPYPYAGIPWFCTAFGRDAIITALQTLWLAPELTRGVLAYLAEMQATTVDPAMDAEPGKILHETRKGEMAALGEVPFSRYYGSVDSTPLFVVLAAKYYKRTGDREFIRSIWPNIGAALAWMRDYADPDEDGFLEYDRRSDKGLSNQGWKDSNDSIFHADGRLAEPPIALVEVQGYAYAAWRGAALLGRALGDSAVDDYEARAQKLRQRFEEVFWCPEIGTYALALDGAKRPCRVRTSNAGHALFSGIASPAHAARVAATLMDDSSFSDWGIRTVAVGEARYNPMSYHNGSVWPHDNGLIALGLARYGLREPLLKVMGGLFGAAAATELHRLPELFCGFPRRAGEGPTSYPVACSPQAWSSAAAFAVMGAALGVSFNPAAGEIRFTRPALPDFLDEVTLEHLRMGDVSVDLLFRRYRRDTSLNVLRKAGEAEIVLVSG
ncbi:MAG TPA: amylo-alpha-1,6-glucosidase [Stellaceae bacterium]|nr:amylo-alpha-1,6-glucosidase [Stellaceae bacterium]